MWTSKLSRTVAVMAVVSMLGAATETRAGGTGAVIIQNPTQNPLSYQMRLGYEDSWTDYDVQPGTHLQIYFDLDHNGRTPPPNIRFDYIAGDNCVSNKVYELDFYELEYYDDFASFPYEFQYNTDGDRLDLYKLD